MTGNNPVFTLTLTGPFRLESIYGSRIEVRSKRAQALIAMLAVSATGERARGWLQEKLWGSRTPEQANASLRRELSNLRKYINHGDIKLLNSDNGRVWLDIKRIDIVSPSPSRNSSDEFLEGLDIAGEDGFEQWLREQRAIYHTQQNMGDEANGIDEETASEPKPNLRQFSKKSTIAVLPFLAQGSASETQHIADGLSEDLIDRLSRLRWLPVIARSSSFALAGKTIDLATAAQSLGADYIVEGTLRNDKDKQILHAILNDTRNGQAIWSKKIHVPLQAKSDTLETLMTEICSALGVQIDIQEQKLALRKPQSDLNISELIWQGRWHLNTLTTDGFEKATKCFDAALKKEPHSPEALIQSAWARLWTLWFNRGSPEEIQDVRKMAQRAIVADYEDARGYMLAGIAETWLHQPLRAEVLLKRAIELNPSLAFAHAHLGGCLYLCGKPKAAIEQLDLAIRLSPNDQHLFYFTGERAIAHLMLGNHELAIKDADISIMRRPAYWYSHVIKINALIRSLKSNEAGQAITDLHNNFPNYDNKLLDWIPFTDSNWNNYLKEGLNLLPS